MKLDKTIVKSIGGVAVLIAAWAIPPAAMAADTHNYDAYVKLKADTTCTSGYPAADKWNPEGEMVGSGYYLIPSGKTLRSNTADSTKGGVWPGRELAVKGTFRIDVSGARANCPTITNLALCAGGKIVMTSAFSTLLGDTIDIRGTAAAPSIIECTLYHNDSSNSYWRYPLLDMAFTGDEDSVVRFKYSPSSANAVDFDRAFRATCGFAGFLGTVIVDGARTWLRPETSATTFDIGGTLCVTNGAGVYVATVSPTFGSLVLASDATLQLYSGRTVTVTNSLSIAEGAKIIVNSLTATAFVYDNGSSTPPEIPVLSVCGAANAAAVDRDALLAAIAAGGVFKSTLASGIPRLVLVESARADGGVDFKVSHSPIVKQTKGCTAGTGPYGYDQYSDYLSDGGEVSPNKDYYDSGCNIYFKTPYEFPGRSLSVSGMVGFYNYSSFEVADLRLLDGAWFRQMKKDCTVHLRGAATLYGTPNFRVNGSGMFVVDSTLAGSGNLIVALDVAKCRNEGSAYLGTLSLEGDNSAWSGRALVGCGRESTADIGLSNLTLRVTTAAGLGGAMKEFTFDGVKVADTCTLSITDTATFDAANRGWCLMDGATVSVAANKVATMGESVTFGGASVKSGNGTLILGGAAKFYDDENDEATDTPNGATLQVAAGSLGVVATNALDGVGVTFASGASMIVDVEATGDLKALGMRNVATETPFAAVGGGSIPVSFTGAFAGNKDTVAICTISPTAATPTFALPRKHAGLSVEASGWRTNPDGSRTLEVRFAKKGVIIVIQ